MDTASTSPSSKPVVAAHVERAEQIKERLISRHAAPREDLEMLHEANFRETLEHVRLALRPLKIGTFAHEQIAATLDALRREIANTERAKS